MYLDKEHDDLLLSIKKSIDDKKSKCNRHFVENAVTWWNISQLEMQSFYNRFLRKQGRWSDQL